MNEALQAAIERLPQYVHNRADCLLQEYGKDSAKSYLKQQILNFNPGVRFAKPIPGPESRAETREVETLSGKKCSVEVCGRIVSGIRSNNGKLLVSRAQLCKAFGWGEKKLTRIPLHGMKAAKLQDAGYSFREFSCPIDGAPHHAVYLLQHDAEIAVKALGAIKGVSHAA